MIHRAKAPLRISFCGGGTDVSPYPEERGGCVLSATIDKYAWASVAPRDGEEIDIASLDYDLRRRYPLDRLDLDGKMDLPLGALAHFRDLRGGLPGGAEVTLHCDAPPGSGLGSSSTVVATLVGCIAQWLGFALTPYEIAETTYKIERLDVRLSGGRQDQYAAAFGGFNFIEFLAGQTIVNPLRIPRETVNELEYHLLLVYTGGTRVSARIVDTQMERYRRREPAAVGGLDRLKELTIELKNLLLRAQLDAFGRCLHEAWETKKSLAEAITNATIDELYAAARAAGALGGKILGAGGGGHLLIYCPIEKKSAIASALAGLGGRIVPFAFEERGLQTWRVP
ncbi:MAG: GHMP kinase [Candidatus Eisenbacteria bacterium]|nr:GHMP kinase [Candidatus Eisenbacteria bacterium]